MSGIVVRVPWPRRELPSAKVLRTCASFGLAIDRRARTNDLDTPHIAREIVRRLRAHPRDRKGRAVLLTGPSGCGKSTLLRTLARLARERGERVIIVAHPRSHKSRRTPIVDLMPGSLAHALSFLARAGLGEAMLLSRTPDELSEGEGARLAIALAMNHAARSTRRTTLICDEFTSVLDRATAKGVAAALARFVASSPHVTLIAATPHDDIATAMHLHLLVGGSLKGGRRHATPHGERTCDWTIVSSATGPSTTTPRSSDSTIAPGRPRRSPVSCALATQGPTSDLASSLSPTPRSTGDGVISRGRAKGRRTKPRARRG